MLSTLFYFGDEDRYITRQSVWHSHKEAYGLSAQHNVPMPMALFETRPEQRSDYGGALQWLCESQTEAADVYFKGIAAVLMFKDIMRVICNLGSHLDDSLWQNGTDGL